MSTHMAARCHHEAGIRRRHCSPKAQSRKTSRATATAAGALKSSVVPSSPAKPPPPPAAQAETKGRAKETKDQSQRLPVFINNKKKPMFAASYVEMVRMPSLKATAVILGILGANVILFFIIYATDASGFAVEGSNESGATASYFQIFLFSLGTTTTLGIAPVQPASNFSLLFANLQAIVVQMLLVFVTGVVFTRLSHVKPSITASKCAVLSSFQGERALRIRFVFDSPEDEIVDVRYELVYARRITLPSGESFYKLDNLELVRAEAMRLLIAGSVIHIIDEESPLYGKSASDLKAEDANIHFGLFGSEKHSMGPVFYSKAYRCGDDEVKDGVRHADLIKVNKDGLRMVDHAMLDILKPASPEPAAKSPEPAAKNS